VRRRSLRQRHQNERRGAALFCRCTFSVVSTPGPVTMGQCFAKPEVKGENNDLLSALKEELEVRSRSSLDG